MAELSPAEKFDIFRGRYDFPLLASERARTSPDLPAWEGLCHGWAAAALGFKEPAAVKLTSADGIEVPFGSADVKALLTYVQGQVSDAPAPVLGERCDLKAQDKRRFAADPACEDTNAGAFHLVLANQIGLMDTGFIADVTRDDEVWNHPVHSFSSKVLETHGPSKGAAKGTVRELDIETSMTYAIEVDPQWDQVALESSTKTYKYRLELDRGGQVIGGAWLGSERPDFLWTQGAAKLAGEFEALRTVYEAATQGQ